MSWVLDTLPKTTPTPPAAAAVTEEWTKIPNCTNIFQSKSWELIEHKSSWIFIDFCRIQIFIRMKIYSREPFCIAAIAVIAVAAAAVAVVREEEKKNTVVIGFLLFRCDGLTFFVWLCKSIAMKGKKRKEIIISLVYLQNTHTSRARERQREREKPRPSHLHGCYGYQIKSSSLFSVSLGTIGRRRWYAYHIHTKTERKKNDESRKGGPIEFCFWKFQLRRNGTSQT